MIELLVWKDTGWKKSVNDTVPGAKNKLIIFRTLDGNKEYKLNITNYEKYGNNQLVKDVWESKCREGNAVKVELQNETHVNKFGPCEVTREVKKPKLTALQMEKKTRFERLAPQRADNVIDTLRILGNCGEKSQYLYGEQQVLDLTDKIEDKLSEVKSKLLKGVSDASQ